MLSKNKAKFIKSLQLKKHRQECGSFVVEGKKSVLELLDSRFQTETILCAEEFWKENEMRLEDDSFETIVCSLKDLESLSSFKTNCGVLAVAKIEPDSAPGKLEGLTLALDGLNDPGNLGTILRTTDWFGLKDIVASEDTADFYNPKTIQASMGSFCRVRVHYLNLLKLLESISLPVYAACVKGKNARDFAFKKDCLLLIGSESHGIRSALMPFASETIGIPPHGKAESLNVAAAAAILCDNYRRYHG